MSAIDSRVLPIEEGVVAMLVGIIESYHLLKVGSGRCQFSEPKQRLSKCEMSLQQETHVLYALRQP
jgi:hypothetical protein